MMKRTCLDISFADRRWRKIPKLEASLEKAVRELLKHLPAKLRLPYTATVLLTNDVAIRKLNHDFRGMDKPTNVLSFPQYEPRRLPKMGKSKEPIYIGDVALAYQYIVGEAKNSNKILINHIIHLVIHGLLHLLGYDHQTDKDATRMEGLETKIMSALDLPGPYVTAKPMELKRAKATARKRRAIARPKR